MQRELAATQPRSTHVGGARSWRLACSFATFHGVAHSPPLLHQLCQVGGAWRRQTRQHSRVKTRADAASDRVCCPAEARTCSRQARGQVQLTRRDSVPGFFRPNKVDDLDAVFELLVRRQIPIAAACNTKPRQRRQGTGDVVEKEPVPARVGAAPRAGGGVGGGGAGRTYLMPSCCKEMAACGLCPPCSSPGKSCSAALGRHLVEAARARTSARKRQSTTLRRRSPAATELGSAAARSTAR